MNTEENENLIVEDATTKQSTTKDQPGKANLLIVLWRGAAPLVITYWLFGVVITFIFAGVSRELMMVADSKLLQLCVLQFLLLYQIFISVAIWRSAKNYGGKVVYRRLAQVAVVISWFGS